MSEGSEVSRSRRHLPDLLALFTVIAVTALVFGRHSGMLGFYADDPGFLEVIHPEMSLVDIIDASVNYVTGRNLHMLWQYFVTVLAGGREVQHLVGMHYVQAAGDCINGALLFAVLRIWGARPVAALAAALAFSLFPNHSETHFWLSALPMNIGSTFFVLLLLLMLGLLVLAVRQRDTTRAYRLALPLALIYVCAMFTYDQAVPVVVASISLVLLFTALHRGFRLAAAVGLIGVLSLMGALLAWKVANPAGGPVFSHLSLAHVFGNFILSLKIWVPSFLFPLDAVGVGGLQAHAPEGAGLLVRLFPMAVLAPRGDWLAAFAAALLASFALYSLARKESSTVSGGCPAPTVGLPAWALFVLGGGFYLLAYLPGFLWFLSPRHSYLPSVGVAIMLAAGISAFPGGLLRMRVVAAALALVVSAQLAGYGLANQVDKAYWIEAFSLRKKMYEQVADDFAGRPVVTSLLLAGFPAALQPNGPALAFLTGEQASAVSIITGRKVSANMIALHPVPAESGYFVRTEESRWGEDAFAYLPKDRATVLVFKGRENGKIRFVHDLNGSVFRPDHFFSVERLPDKVPGGVNRLAVASTARGFEIAVPRVALKRNEVLALIACQTKDGKLSPVAYQRPGDNEPFLLPVQVPAAGAEGVVLRLRYKVPLEGIDSFRLYKVGPDKAVLVGDTAAVAG